MKPEKLVFEVDRVVYHLVKLFFLCIASFGLGQIISKYPRNILQPLEYILGLSSYIIPTVEPV